jgi:hypothetical protein
MVATVSFMKTGALIAGCVCLLMSCQSKEQYLTKKEFHHKTDSLTAVRFQELKLQSAEDLDRRIAIEVKPKVDSILGKTTLPPSAEKPVSSDEQTHKQDTAVTGRGLLPFSPQRKKPLDSLRTHGRKQPDIVL